MQSLSSATGLTITNPLVLYRALLATKRIDPDPAQHRLALHLQKLYHRLKDYEPSVDYKYQIDRLARTVGKSSSVPSSDQDRGNPTADGGRRSIFSSFRDQKEKAEALALTRKLTSHESAVQLQSPQGLLLYGEVGTGKSMLVDLLADSLPNRKKRRWHFNTFMLETFAKLEQLRRSRLASKTNQEEEYSLLWLARDMISNSPILFLDEFQLPDRAASKILSNLFTSFFHLGGVLIATSNRMPEELANASGLEFAAPPTSRLGTLRSKWGLLASSNSGGKSESMFGSRGDFAAFLEVLRARCEIWDMEGGKDWRRREVEEFDSTVTSEGGEPGTAQGFQGLQPMAAGNWGLGYEQSVSTSSPDRSTATKGNNSLPKYYFVKGAVDRDPVWESAVLRAAAIAIGESADIPWQNMSLRVYGRTLLVPRHLSGVTCWTFDQLCATSLGPADYITLASTFHTFILTEVPVLTLLHKNEARRLITLLDALYEARCKLLIQSAAGPDDIFFPDTYHSPAVTRGDSTESAESGDGVYSETFSEIYQDQTSPFRPNIAAYNSSASVPSYNSSPLPSFPSGDSSSARSILADEDSDFGPTYGAGRSSNSRFHGPSDGAPGAGNEIGSQSSPNFARTATFTGEDEKFAYKRARSRLWEMCGARWWEREGDGWWRPSSKEVRRWEDGEIDRIGTHSAANRQDDASSEVKSVDSSAETLFRHGASPFRTSQDPPPKISWTHAWGMVKWGKKAGAWGQGPERLEERDKGRTDVKEQDKTAQRAD
ncbi:MAG: hypothetical protein Q9201_000546 [Fulgogasparrea decipioides]